MEVSHGSLSGLPDLYYENFANDFSAFITKSHLILIIWRNSAAKDYKSFE